MDYVTQDQFKQLALTADKILDHLQDGAHKFGRLEELTDRLETSVRRIEVILLEGNHRPSLLAQVETLKAAPAALDKKTTFLGTTAERVALITALGSILVSTMALLR